MSVSLKHGLKLTDGCSLPVWRDHAWRNAAKTLWDISLL